MIVEVRLPQFGLTMETAEVVRWLKSEGDSVAKGEPLVELQNDKAVVPHESPGSGYLHILAPQGAALPVGSLLALKVEAFEPDACPLCRKGIPITKPGASDKKA
jgi:pyruvate/2-oxoglutarate dehydrogenase complex dihydrolipoamide acyltransferase (E2) component